MPRILRNTQGLKNKPNVQTAIHPIFAHTFLLGKVHAHFNIMRVHDYFLCRIHHHQSSTHHECNIFLYELVYFWSLCIICFGI